MEESAKKGINHNTLTTPSVCPICAYIDFKQRRDTLPFSLVRLARLGFVLVLKA